MERAGPLMEGPRALMEMASLKKVNISMAGRTVVLPRVLGRTQKNGGAKKDLQALRAESPEPNTRMKCPTITHNQWCTKPLDQGRS